MSELPVAPVDRIIRKTEDMRVSKSATEELVEILENVAMEIANDASELAKNAGRKTIKDTDVREASERRK